MGPTCPLGSSNSILKAQRLRAATGPRRLLIVKAGLRRQRGRSESRAPASAAAAGIWAAPLPLLLALPDVGHAGDGVGRQRRGACGGESAARLLRRRGEGARTCARRQQLEPRVRVLRAVELREGGLLSARAHGRRGRAGGRAGGRTLAATACRICSTVVCPSHWTLRVLPPGARAVRPPQEGQRARRRRALGARAPAVGQRQPHGEERGRGRLRHRGGLVAEQRPRRRPASSPAASAIGQPPKLS